MLTTKSSEIVSKISDLRKFDSANFQSNYFLTPICDEVLFSENEQALIFLQKEADFYRLYYASTSLNSLEELFKKLPNKEIYFELILKKEPDEDLKNLLGKYFSHEATYQKMYKKLEPSAPLALSENNAVSDVIFDKIYSTFNHYYDHLMDKNELEALIADNKVLTIHEADTLQSFLIYKLQGKKAYLNHIANYGTKQNLLDLWKKFYQYLNNDSVTYLDLWYDKANKKAENMYQIEQFQPLNMYNFIYKKL